MNEQYPETTSKERINAAISYFFMGPMVLLATNNPTFNVLFIQEHAKRATKWLTYAAGAFIVHFFWLSQVTSFFIPIIGIRLDKTLTFCIFLAYFILTLIGAYQALQGMKAQGITFWMKDVAWDVTFSLEMNESEKLRTIACYLPIISLFVKNPNELGKIGRVTSNWFTVLLLVIVTLGFTEISQLALSSLYILFVVSLGVFIFLNKEPTFLRLVAFLPKKEAVQAGIYTIPLYLWQVVQAIIGKRSELSFLEEFTKKLQKEEQFEKAMSEVFTDNSSPFSPYTLYIPGINAIHLTTFFSPKKSRNVIASGQGIIITILFALGIYFFNEYDSILLVLVYVSLLGIARVKERPFYKIPVVYEIYWLISLVTFGLISGAGTAKNKSVEVREETIKVQP